MRRDVGFSGQSFRSIAENTLCLHAKRRRGLTSLSDPLRLPMAPRPGLEPGTYGLTVATHSCARPRRKSRCHRRMYLRCVVHGRLAFNILEHARASKCRCAAQSGRSSFRGNRPLPLRCSPSSRHRDGQQRVVRVRCLQSTNCTFGVSTVRLCNRSWLRASRQWAGTSGAAWRHC